MERNRLGGVSADHLEVETGDMRDNASPSGVKADLLDAEQVTPSLMGRPLHHSAAVRDYRTTVSKSGAAGASSLTPGLAHSKTAPARATVYEDVGLEGQGQILPRSKTEKKGTLKYDLKLDRLPEREKKELIENLIRIQNDGTVAVDVSRSASVASELLELDSVGMKHTENEEIDYETDRSVPKLKIAILVVGTRGDVQPFLAIAKRLQEFGHIVRLATHSNFRVFVKSAGVDFFPLAGDPRILAGYMARNKGFLPSGPSEISEQRKQLKMIIDSLLPACTEPDLETGVPFRAQAVIANPPAYGHAHVAEALGVPLHIFFTMPWTPTHEFPHPLARVSQTAGYRLSYLVVDLIIWWTIRGFINDFRKRKLSLPPIAYFSTYHGSISHLPTGYMWSPHLVPKPIDWGAHVNVVGFCFLNLGSKYEPQKQFVEWIQKGTKPIYVGFGSMPLEDAEQTTTIILAALRDTGQRGIIDKGWGDLGIFKWLADQRYEVSHLSDCRCGTRTYFLVLRVFVPDKFYQFKTKIAIYAGLAEEYMIVQEAPDNVFLLEDCPHDWLFPQCSAVVHHGGAGTTATGLRAGCPTTIVPFFGDQFFWGDRIHAIGVGPAPIPIAYLTVENLSDAIRFMLEPEVKLRAMDLAKKIENEDGVAAAVDAFHRHLHFELPTTPSSLDDDPAPSESNPFQWLIRFLQKCCHPSS